MESGSDDGTGWGHDWDADGDIEPVVLDPEATQPDQHNPNPNPDEDENGFPLDDDEPRRRIAADGGAPDSGPPSGKNKRKRRPRRPSRTVERRKPVRWTEREASVCLDAVKAWGKLDGKGR